MDSLKLKGALFTRPVSYFVLFVFILLINTGCNQDTDSSLKADLTAKAMVERDFQGVNFTVKDAVVTLSGSCPTQKAKDAVEKKVANTYRVKQVINGIDIAPVVIGTDDLLKRSVDSVLQYYPGATAITKDSTVYLQGHVANDKEQELTQAINSLQPKTVENKLEKK